MDYFKDAKVWYHDIYISSYYTRFFYFFIFVLNVLNLSISFQLKNNYNSGVEKLYIIAKIDYNRDETLEIKDNIYKTREMNIANFAIKNYVEDIESLQYNTSDDLDNVLIKKMHKLNNIFTKDLFREYSDFNNKDLNADIEYIKKGMQKIANLQEIVFCDKNGKDITANISYKLFNITNIDNIKIKLAIYDEITGEESLYEVFLRYDILLPDKKDDPVSFKIKEYKKQPI